MRLHLTLKLQKCNLRIFYKLECLPKQAFLAWSNVCEQGQEPTFSEPTEWLAIDEHSSLLQTFNILLE
jgi:hypothetical protein